MEIPLVKTNYFYQLVSAVAVLKGYLSILTSISIYLYWQYLKTMQIYYFSK